MLLIVLIVFFSYAAVLIFQYMFLCYEHIIIVSKLFLSGYI
jgi:hypothetical protein